MAMALPALRRNWRRGALLGGPVWGRRGDEDGPVAILHKRNNFRPVGTETEELLLQSPLLHSCNEQVILENHDIFYSVHNMHLFMTVRAQSYGVLNRISTTPRKPYNMMRLQVWAPCFVSKGCWLFTKLTDTVGATFCVFSNK